MCGRRARFLRLRNMAATDVVPLARACEIFHDAYRTVSGLCRTVRGRSMSATPGKVCVDGVAEVAGEKVFALHLIQARDPELVGQAVLRPARSARRLAVRPGAVSPTDSPSSQPRGAPGRWDRGSRAGELARRSVAVCWPGPSRRQQRGQAWLTAAFPIARQLAAPTSSRMTGITIVVRMACT